MILFVPEPVTCELVTDIFSINESSETFLIVIFPVSTSTDSENVKTILLSTATLVALSAGELFFRVGAIISGSGS